MDTLNLKCNGDCSWSINLSTHEFECSKWMLDMCGLSPEAYNLREVLTLIKPEHKNRVQKSIDTLFSTEIFEEVTFKILTRFGYRWARAYSHTRSRDSINNVCILGHFDFLSEEELREGPNKEDEVRLGKWVNRNSSISDTLLELLYVSDKSSVILKTLDNLLEEFSGDRAYIFEYDLKNKTQHCTYEVVRKSIGGEQENLQNIPIEATAWWSEMLLHRNEPIIFDNIRDLPAEASSEYQILDSQNIQSIMVVPLMVKNGVGGYMGIDMVGRQYSWSESDQQWFQSLANIISLCIELKKSEQDALAERERYRKLYQNMPIGFIRIQLIYDEHGKPIDFIHKDINDVGNKIAEACGENNILSKRNSEVNSQVSKEQLEMIAQLVKTKEVCSKKTVKIGESYFDYTLYSIENDDIIVLIQDNTQSVIASRALRKSEETLQNIYNNVPIGIEIYDKDGILININNIEQEIFGLESKEQALGLNLFENPNLPQTFLDDLLSNKPSWCDFFYDFGKLSSYYSSKCSGLKHIVLKGNIVYDLDHNVENYILIVIDNTDTLRASHKIREFEVLFNSIAEFAEVGLCQWNYHQKTIFGTDQWYDNLGQSNREISDIMEAYTEVHEDDKERLRQHFDNITSGRAMSFREEIRIQQGQKCKWLNVLFKVSDYTPEENRFEIIGINIDITTLKETEHMLIEAKQKAEESDNLKSAFLANMSHEIRTPLNAIVGFSELLIDAEEIEERQQYLSIIRKNNELLLQLISDILDISKIESGMIDINLGPIDIREICTEIVCTQAMKVTNEVKILFDNPDTPCVLTTDRNRLNQVLSNLIGNAIKFTSAGSITVGYQIEEKEVRFYVQDTGIGISQDQLQCIFSRFIKLNTFIHGTGLGLSICKSLIEKMGGRIWVESTLGQGACFYFTLPNRELDPQE